jgi:hypothetical protein
LSSRLHTAIEQDGADAGRTAGADREPDAAGEAADRVVEGQGPGSGDDMDEDQRQDHRWRRKKSECRLCRKDRRLDEHQDRRGERDETAQIEVAGRPLQGPSQPSRDSWRH